MKSHPVEGRIPAEVLFLETCNNRAYWNISTYQQHSTHSYSIST